MLLGVVETLKSGPNRNVYVTRNISSMEIVGPQSSFLSLVMKGANYVLCTDGESHGANLSWTESFNSLGHNKPFFFLFDLSTVFITLAER